MGSKIMYKIDTLGALEAEKFKNVSDQSIVRHPVECFQKALKLSLLKFKRMFKKD